MKECRTVSPTQTTFPWSNYSLVISYFSWSMKGFYRVHDDTLCPFTTSGVHFILNATNYLYSHYLCEFFHFRQESYPYLYYYLRDYFSNTNSIIKKNVKQNIMIWKLQIKTLTKWKLALSKYVPCMVKTQGLWPPTFVNPQIINMALFI